MHDGECLRAATKEPRTSPCLPCETPSCARSGAWELELECLHCGHVLPTSLASQWRRFWYTAHPRCQAGFGSAVQGGACVATTKAHRSMAADPCTQIIDTLARGPHNDAGRRFPTLWFRTDSTQPSAGLRVSLCTSTSSLPLRLHASGQTCPCEAFGTPQVRRGLPSMYGTMQHCAAPEDVVHNFVGDGWYWNHCVVDSAVSTVHPRASECHSWDWP